ncbi:MAG: MarR family transcriptional regulator [Spirochaetaceae bacterium]|jgi:DNA-binding MarR family transcriptional regulator|nr:MarR family transcriptional regulator [Spirochaetaceae bacterium]
MKYDALKLENQLCFPLYAASREVIKLYLPFLKPLGLTYTQYITLMPLWERGSMKLKELAKTLYLTSGTLTPLVKKLEKQGLLRREKDKEDERDLIVSLSPEGEALQERALHIPLELGKCINLQADEAAELYRLLYKILST